MAGSSEIVDESPPNALCDVCKYIFADGSYEWWDTFWKGSYLNERRREALRNADMFGIYDNNLVEFSKRHHSSRADVQLAARDGCWVCLRLSNASPASQDDTPLSYMIFPEESKGGKEDQGFTLYFDFPRVSFTLKPSPLTEIDSLARRSRSREYIGQEYTAKPSRLLDISSDRIKLINGCNVPRDEEYSTLSYCWGKTEFIVLNTVTMDQFLEGVNTLKLPLIIQHAILTVRRLNIKYLWVDCYCIIQGNEPEAQADWESESISMGEVYKNGLVNICAATTDEANKGIFTQRESCLAGHITIRWSIDQEKHLLFELGVGRRFVQMERSFGRLLDGPLMKRGWVLQECALSRRMILFTRGDVIWHCSESTASEDNPDGTIDHEYHAGSSGDGIVGHPFWPLKLTWTADSVERVLGYGWFTFLNHYIRTHLSFPDKDVLRAIEGIGREIQKLTGVVLSHGILGGTPSHIIRPFLGSLASELYSPSSEPLRYKPFGLSVSGGGPQSKAAARTSRADFCGVRQVPLGNSHTSNPPNTPAKIRNTTARTNQELWRTMPVSIAAGSTARTDILLRIGSSLSRL
ncbi:heterokaryon incompatibility protein-domain-containing protein [Hypoxylon trugodes]|uniref:heterokaryon incompatibility protein-domain-containing protein n=1 Tax=Hypoxylon trugodes TaxID=326681 RepID=UPI00218FADE8|nr:heterokaryon incompatibility protein-domain-containing protein [Hypoxylon trugodes]KAI1391620.1 heterokaryon incompatibility protein-domain-containing protein [Hypoxylon trugodes]